MPDLIKQIIAPFVTILLLSTNACVAQPEKIAPHATASKKVTGTRTMTEAELVYNLPHARGQGFATLDAYLAHLKELSKVDVPYYKQIGPELYEKQTGRGSRGKPPQTFTRQQLCDQFGFKKCYSKMPKSEIGFGQ